MLIKLIVFVQMGGGLDSTVMHSSPLLADGDNIDCEVQNLLEESSKQQSHQLKGQEMSQVHHGLELDASQERNTSVQYHVEAGTLKEQRESSNEMLNDDVDGDLSDDISTAGAKQQIEAMSNTHGNEASK